MDLKRYRRFNEIPSARVCKELGINASTLSRYEHGQRFPRPDILLKIIKWSNGQVTASDIYKKRK